MSRSRVSSTPHRFAGREVLLAALAVALIGAGVFTMSADGAKAGATTTKKASGPVDVLYAGSLLDLMQQKIGPAFHKATGYTVSGYSNGFDGARERDHRAARRSVTSSSARRRRSTRRWRAAPTATG